MNIVKELETILRQPNFMGNDKTGCNLAVNQILDRIDELGLEIVEKKKENEITITLTDNELVHTFKAVSEKERIETDETKKQYLNSAYYKLLKGYCPEYDKVKPFYKI